MIKVHMRPIWAHKDSIYPATQGRLIRPGEMVPFVLGYSLQCIVVSVVFVIFRIVDVINAVTNVVAAMQCNDPRLA